MSLSNFQLNLLLEELDRRMQPLKDAMDEPNPSLTQMAMLQAAHDSGKLLGMLQTKYLLLEWMEEDERKRQAELAKLRDLHGLRQEYLNHQAHHPPVNWEEAVAMIKKPNAFVPSLETYERIRDSRRNITKGEDHED